MGCQVRDRSWSRWYNDRESPGSSREFVNYNRRFLNNFPRHEHNLQLLLNEMKYSRIVLGLCYLWGPAVVKAENYQLLSKPTCNETIIGGFTHPGIFHSCEDLTRMQTKVWAGEEPWTTAFGRMFNESLVGLSVASSNGYHIRGPLPELPYGEDSWSSNFTVDCQYAYLNSLAYFITGHPFHRERAIHTVRRWTTSLNVLEEYIRGGNGLRYMGAAAEILRSTNTSGWWDTDTQLFHDFTTRVRENWDSTNGMTRPDLFFNQGGYANGGALSLAVFIGDLDMYKQVIQQATVGANPDPTIDYAIAKEISNDTDFYGQVAEMGRDQGHPAGWLGILGSMAYTASIQGDLDGQIEEVDLFKFDDHRLLAGMEYFAQYNLGHDVPWKSRQIGHDSPERYTELAPSDRGMIYRTQQHPTDIGALNAPTAAYYRFKEIAPDRVKFLKTYVEAQTIGLDTLAFAKKGLFEDLEYHWENGYGASYMDVLTGSASRRRSEAGETVESLDFNNTGVDIAILEPNTNISYPLFFSTMTKPFIRFEARSEGGAEITISNVTDAVVANYRVPASKDFTTVFLNTTLIPEPGHQMFFVSTSGGVEIARLNMTEASDVSSPFEDSS